MRVSAAADEVDDGDALGHGRALREERDVAGEPLGPQRPDVVVGAVGGEVDAALGGAQQTGEPAQDGRLAAAVGADDDGDLPAGTSRSSRSTTRRPS